MNKVSLYFTNRKVINQILHILNSYRKYGITDTNHCAYIELNKYLRLVDVFYKSGGQYQYLLDQSHSFYGHQILEILINRY